MATVYPSQQLDIISNAALHAEPTATSTMRRLFHAAVEQKEHSNIVI